MLERLPQEKFMEVSFNLPKSDLQVEIPNDLLHILSKLKQVKRYVDPELIPEGLIDDNTYLHSLRLACIGRQTPLANTTRLLVHDFDELHMARDINSITKAQNKYQDRKPRSNTQSELSSLSGDYLAFIRQFEQASNYFKGRLEIDEVEDQTALVDKAIDEFENRIVFHYYYTNWLKERGNNYDGEIPPEVVWRFTLKQNLEYRERLNDPSIREDVVEVCIDLFDRQLKQTLRLWEKVDKNKIPKTQMEELKLTKEYLGSNI